MKDFVPYESALELKELGFDEPCFKCKVIGQEHLDYTPSDYDDFPEQKEVEVLIPTFSQAFRWFREKYNLKSWIQEHTPYTFIYEIRPHKLTDYKEGEVYVYNTHEEAELACLQKLIELCKK
jgi:hypothetical protein